MPDVPESELLRFLTAGSVDDGKSTLVGRLLCDSNAIYEDQIASVRSASSHSNGHFDFSFVTDGLKAEREQAITIDVAYRYFSTGRRKFIIADSPGHEQYTRNMVTGASTADLALLLVDARKGPLKQTFRHAYIAWLLGIRRIVIAVNKMDLVEFDQDVFVAIRDGFTHFPIFWHCADTDTDVIPISALEGDNVVSPSKRMDWYRGPSLLHLLESVPINESRNLQDFRFPVQCVLRPHQDYRGYAGQISSGVVKQGQEVMALPSRQTTRVERIDLYERRLEEAFPPLSVVLSVSDHLDLGRGDMLVDPERPPTTSTIIIAKLVWLSIVPLQINKPYIIRHTTQTVCGFIRHLTHAIDVHTLEELPAETLRINEVGVVQIEMHKPIFCDAYSVNRRTGSFILIDPVDNSTIAAGMISETIAPKAQKHDLATIRHVQGHPTLSQHKGLTVWLTGLSGSGKSTISAALYTELIARGFRAEVLDADTLRKHLNSDLGFSKRDRDENVRRIGFVAELLTRNGVIVIVAAISPYRSTRDEVRQEIISFLEVHVNAPLKVCEERDQKGLYRRARLGEIRNFTGIDDPYEAPEEPDVRCDTAKETLKASTERVLEAVLRYLSA